LKIYTKTGDAGETGLYGGGRISKASVRVEAYGEIDELNSVLGLLRSEGAIDATRDALLATIQSRLFDLGAELANPRGKMLGIPLITDSDVEALEQAIDSAEAELTPLRTFVLPGGTRLASLFHLARTVCRRAERRVVALAEAEAGSVRPECLRYLNRLSDLLFVLARLANRRAGVPDVPWMGRSSQRADR
jgi:cob(I)alamin adenosyltransferase